MEYLGYVDIYATKGIEYLLVIGYLLLLIPFWMYLTKPAKQLQKQRQPILQDLYSKWFRLKEQLFYHPGHTWVALEDAAVARVGLDDFAQKLIGKPDEIQLPRIGTRIHQGEPAFHLIVDSKKIPVLAPVSGEVVEVNQKVLQSKEVLLEDPYDKGWMFKVKSSRIKTSLRNLLSGRFARAWMAATVHQLRQMMSGELGVVMQDGGVPVPGFVKSLSPDRWDEIVKEFLLNEIQ